MLRQKNESPVGELFITVEGSYLTSIAYDEPTHWEYSVGEEKEQDVYKQVIQQMEAYFEGKLECFDVPLLSQGTDFQKRVWQALSEIPYGAVVSYKEIAIRAGSPKAVQALGQANRANPFPIIIPCHRCVKSNGELGGYNEADVDKKQYLLALEKGLSFD